MLQDLVADPVHGRDDGGVRVPDVHRRHVGHGSRVHDVGRHAAAASSCSGHTPPSAAQSPEETPQHCELSQLTEELHSTRRPTDRRPTDRPPPARARACAPQPRTGDRRAGATGRRRGDRGTDDMPPRGGPAAKQQGWLRIGQKSKRARCVMVVLVSRPHH